MMFFSLLSHIISVFANENFISVGDVTQCAFLPKTGCSLPQWDVRWDMAGSGYSYCWHECPMDWFANNTHLGVFAGVVGVDHYYTNQGMPCIDGIPKEFQMQDEFALKLKKKFPDVRVLQYRITDAVPYDKLVHDKMISDPDFFVRWLHAPNNNGSICLEPAEHKTGPPYGNCSWEIRAGAYDWTQKRVRDWYLENIIKPTMRVADGAWIDGDGPDNGAYQCSGNFEFSKLPKPYPALNAEEVDAFCKGEALVVDAAQRWLIANKGFDYNCFDFKNGPEAGDSVAQCANSMKYLSNLKSPKAMVMYGNRVRSDGYNDTTISQAVAAFMIVRDEYWFFGLPAQELLVDSTGKLLLLDYGKPLNSMMEIKTNTFSREYQRANITLDCNTFSARFDI